MADIEGASSVLKMNPKQMRTAKKPSPKPRKMSTEDELMTVIQNNPELAGVFGYGKEVIKPYPLLFAERAGAEMRSLIAKLKAGMNKPSTKEMALKLLNNPDAGQTEPVDLGMMGQMFDPNVMAKLRTLIK